MRDQTYVDVFGEEQFVNKNYWKKNNPWVHW